MADSYTTMQSPLGELVLTASDEGLTGLYTPEHAQHKQAKQGKYNPKPFQKAIKQLEEYFRSERSDFDLELAAQGTKFQKQVWKQLCKISYGKTKNYGEIAKALANENASRAVGTANSKNPISIIVPCHRVIAASGKLSGYAGGVKTKQWLLEHEAKSKKI